MHRYLAAAAFVLGVPALVAPAQDADARTILEASSRAIADTGAFGAQFRMFGDGSALVKSTMPSMSGRLVFARTESGPVLHMLGEAKDTQDATAHAFDFVRTPETLTWTDDAAKKISVRRAKPDARDIPTAARMIHFANLLEPDAFAATLGNVESIEREDSQNVGGEECDVVRVKLGKVAGQSQTDERWFIAKSDRLPRRVEMITDGGMIKFQLITELSGLSVGEQPEDMLDVRRPEGYTLDDRTAAANPTPRPTARDRATPTGADSPTPRPTATPQPPPTDPVAPAFGFTVDGGSPVTNATQSGRVTVLYFWGTWCIPCKQVSPEVSRLAASYADRGVDVFGLALRERDPEAPRAAFGADGTPERLVLDGDAAASAFKVRVYPTIVVIDGEGRVQFQGYPDKQRTAEQLMSGVRSAIDRALGG